LINIKKYQVYYLSFQRLQTIYSIVDNDRDVAAFGSFQSTKVNGVDGGNKVNGVNDVNKVDGVNNGSNNGVNADAVAHARLYNLFVVGNRSKVIEHVKWNEFAISDDVTVGIGLFTIGAGVMTGWEIADRLNKFTK